MRSDPPVLLRRLVQDGVDTRIVLGVYAALAVSIGLSMAFSGLRGLPGVALHDASLIWISGTAILAAGCAAWGLALNDDPLGRRRSLRLFAVGHILLGLMVWLEWGVYWGDHGLPLPVAMTPLLLGLALLGAASPAPHQRMAAATEQRVRSTYDEHIRQIARREERARLARDLHDAVKQQLFVIQTAAATAQTRFDDDADGAREALTHVRTAAREATTEMEALLDELQAAPIESTGLVEALKKQSEALALRTGAQVNFEPGMLPAVGSLPPGAHEAIYRVAQEALANVARHARASRVDVSLNATASRFEMRITDDGAGIDAGPARRGMGIANMESRAAEVGGRVSVAGRSPGTEVRLSVPLANPELRAAWFTAQLFALSLVSTVVYYAIRGNSPERRLSVVFNGLFGVWAAIRLAAAYWKVRPGTSR